ncbi:hypothetical protein Tco_0658332, partial [Tanacetum coccineum]
IPLKKSRGKGSQGNKSATTVDVCDKSDSETARKQTGSRRVIKKKVSISAEDNIIPKPDVALELGKSMSLTEAAEEEAARKVHATHERIVTESNPEPARRRPLGIAFADTSSVSKKMYPDPSQKKNSIQTLTAEEQLAADTMQLLKAIRKSNRSQSLTGCSSEGIGVSPGVPDESTIILATSSEGTGTKPRVPDEKRFEEENVNKEEDDWIYSDDNEEKKDDDKSIDLKKTDDVETDDEFVHSEEYVQEDDDEFVHGDEHVNDDEDEEMKDVEVEESGNGDEEITDTAKANAEKTKEAKDDNKKVELPPSSSSLSVSSDLEKNVTKLELIDHSAEILAIIRSQVPAMVNEYLRSSLGDALQKSTLEILKVKKEQADKQKSFNKHPTNQVLYHALMEALIADEESMDKGVADSLKQQKKSYDDNDEDPSAGTNQGRPGRLTIAAEYFFNNDLDFLKSSDPVKKRTTSITKTKAAWYEIVGIEDMVPTLWSATKVGQKILSVVNVKVQKLHSYGHLEEIVVRRADRQLYKFKEGNFVDLQLNDIEDMLLLAVQHKLFQLNGSDIVDLIMALRMFTRSLIIKRRVKDLQLGVESYQKKLNLTKPQNTFPRIKFKELYTPSFNPSR